ncbi:MAG: hypothetical protein ACOY90_18875 [Candidatus Zhuqueibacterota bacterium]
MQELSPTIRLDSIQTRISVSKGKAKQLMETCVWCLLYCDHSNGVRLNVEDDGTSLEYSVVWPTENLDIEAIIRSYNKSDAIEDGAEAIALLVSIERTEYNCVERAITSTGIDYWLGFKERNPNYPFHRASRLEISGIMSENENNTVRSRIRQKLNQTKLSDYTSFPVYVIIVEFSKPYAIMVVKNVNS